MWWKCLLRGRETQLALYFDSLCCHLIVASFGGQDFSVKCDQIKNEWLFIGITSHEMQGKIHRNILTFKLRDLRVVQASYLWANISHRRLFHSIMSNIRLKSMSMCKMLTLNCTRCIIFYQMSLHVHKHVNSIDYSVQLSFLRMPGTHWTEVFVFIIL